MEKRRESPAPKPNAAPRADAERVLKRIEDLGIKGEDAFEAAGLSRPTYFRMKKYEASVGTVRKIEEWLLGEERRRQKPEGPSKSEEERLMAEWAQLGEDMLATNPARFRHMLESLREVVDAERRMQQAEAKAFRATPAPLR